MNQHYFLIIFFLAIASSSLMALPPYLLNNLDTEMDNNKTTNSMDMGHKDADKCKSIMDDEKECDPIFKLRTDAEEEKASIIRKEYYGPMFHLTNDAEEEEFSAIMSSNEKTISEPGEHLSILILKKNGIEIENFLQ